MEVDCLHLDGAVLTIASLCSLSTRSTLLNIHSAYVSLKTQCGTFFSLRHNPQKMPFVRTPTNNEEAAAYALLGLAQSTGGLAVWLAWIAAVFIPWFVWPLGYLAKSIPRTLRQVVLAIYHFIAIVFSIGCVCALILTLALHLLRKAKWFRDAVCESDPLAESFANNYLIGWLAFTLLVLVSHMLTQPIVAVLCNWKGPGFFSRFAHASQVGAVWWLTTEHSALAFLQAILVTLDILVKHSLALTLLRYKQTKEQRVCEFVFTLGLALHSVIAVVYGGIAYSSRCDADKRHGSLIVVMHILRSWTLLREMLRAVLEYQTFKKIK